MPCSIATDGFSDLGHVGVRRDERGQALAQIVHQGSVTLGVGFRTVDVGGGACVGEVVGTGGERAGHDDRAVDADREHLGGVADGQGVHRGFGGEVRGQEWGAAATGAGAADPHQQP